MALKLNSASGSITLSSEDGSGNVNVTIPRAGFEVGDITGVTAGSGLSGGGTSGTVTLAVDAAQPTVTSLGTLTALTVDNVVIDGAVIGHTGDTDLLTLASGVVTVAGEVSMTTLDIGGTNVTSTAAELNILDGVTSTAAELNILDGVTSTAAELNLLDGVTSTAAELNILDGVTSTAAELNYSDGVTSAIQTQLNTKASGVAAASIKSGNYTMSSGEFIIASAGSITLTLPASPSAGDNVTVKDGTGAAATTAFTVARNSSNIASSATDLTFDKNFHEVTMTYINSTIGWSV